MTRQVCRETITDTTAGITAGAVDSVRNRSILRTGLRLYDGATVGVAGCLGEADMTDLENKARKMLGFVPFPWEPAGEQVCHRERTGAEPGPILDEAEALVSGLSRDFPDILISGKLAFRSGRKSMSGDGLDLSFSHRGFELGLTYKRRESSAIIDGFAVRGGPDWNREQVLEEIRREFAAFLNPAAPPPSGKMTVVFIDSQQVLSQLMADLHGLRYATGSSLLSGKMNSRVFSKDFTLLQYADDFQGSPFFDAEGTVTPTGGLPLIDEGVFEKAFTDIRTSRTYNLPLTGAAAAAYDGVPALGWPEVKVKPSRRTLEQLIADEPAILISVTSGGDFTPTGGFGAPVQLAFLLDGSGKPVGRLPECSISSTVWKMLGEDFLGVSADPFNPSSDQKAMVMKMDVEFPQG